jgi:hypothetical protein
MRLVFAERVEIHRARLEAEGREFSPQLLADAINAASDEEEAERLAEQGEVPGDLIYEMDE